jgi:hypothetical protein
VLGGHAWHVKLDLVGEGVGEMLEDAKTRPSRS